MRRATTGLGVGLYLVTISIHALLAESDRRHRGNDRCPVDFYPRSPCGERQRENADDMYQYAFLSTLSLRRATHYDNYNLHCVEISIHALLAESDNQPGKSNKLAEYFYPRSPCGERRALKARKPSIHVFLSTLSLRRATRADSLAHAPPEISIHALLAESDYQILEDTSGAT